MTELPIDDILPALCASLERTPNAVVQAAPGAGKTTRIPLRLLDAPWRKGGRIVMLEPRRLAARAAAQHMSSLLGEPVGKTVGYRIQLDNRTGPDTVIEVVTEGILTRRLQSDPSLEGVAAVIFDEIHERNLQSDLGLALCLDCQAGLREDLRILAMSATLDAAPVAAVMGDAPVFASAGRAFPVETRYLGKPPADRYRDTLCPAVSSAVKQALNEETGSILVFLPGEGEIRRVEKLLNESSLPGDADVLPLYGALSRKLQDRAVSPAPSGRRKVVLATSIAETSLTIEGVRVVVDAGLARVPRFDPASGMTRLETRRISRASATQRAGRAGRLEPGSCYRLWSEDQHAQLAAFGEAEMLQADLASLALQLARWGAEPAELSWLDMPPPAAYAQAQTLLADLGALQRNARGGWQITAHGQRMATLPAHPRLAHMLLRGHALGWPGVAASLAALLVERDILRGAGADLALRMQALEAGRGADVQRVRQLARQFRSLLPADTDLPAAPLSEAQALAALLAFAYPDRVARQRQEGGGSYRLANGRAAQFVEPDGLMKQPWLVIAELGSQQGQREERIYRAVALDAGLFDGVLGEQVRLHDELDWDEREGVLRAERQRRVGELVLAREPLPSLDEQARGQALLALVRRRGLALLPWTPELRQWQARIALLRRLEVERQGESAWPELSDAALLQRLEEWLLPYLGKVSRLSHFAQLDLARMLATLLPWPLPRQLDELAPVAIEVPSGSRIRLDYSENPPVLAVRLQELFGLAETPRIAGGSQPVKLHLLSPARRPVQVTQDLASFWANIYAEVKKDLKGRYPKHYWPDDPLQAEPTARAKPRR